MQNIIDDLNYDEQTQTLDYNSNVETETEVEEYKKWLDNLGWL